MISPSIDSDTFATRLDRLPAQLRDGLARELDRLGRSLRDRLGGQSRLSLTIDTTADQVTVMIRTAGALARKKVVYRRGRDGHAEDAMALQPLRRLRVLRTSSASSAVSGSLLSIEREIRAGLETAARQALGE